MNTKKIKVMIVDDHLMVRKGLALFVNGSKDMELVGEAEDSAGAIQLYEQENPDVVLMDMMLPDNDGATTISRICKSHPGAKIIALTSFTEDEIIENALQAGASGFLLKNVSVEELASSIRMVHQGKTIFDAKASDVLHRLINRTEADDKKAVFSEREKDVLRLLANGLTNKQIAAHLKVQPSTVKQYLSYIFSKMRVQNRAEAVAAAIRMNMLKK
jgi:NarL family two-component system response regulator LiaR